MADRQIQINPAAAEAVSGRARPPAWLGRYVSVTDLRPGDVLDVTFPVPVSRASYTACAGIPGKERSYACTFRGGTS